MGCYIAGYNQEFMMSGLTSTMIASSSLSTVSTLHGRKLAFSSSMSIEMCVSLCLSNGFFVAGLQTTS